MQSTRCSSFVFDGLDSEVTLVNAPFFDGIREVVNPQTLDCSLDVQWDAGSTVCDGPVRYFVYRASVSPAAPTPPPVNSSSAPAQPTLKPST